MSAFDGSTPKSFPALGGWAGRRAGIPGLPAVSASRRRPIKTGSGNCGKCGSSRKRGFGARRDWQIASGNCGNSPPILGSFGCSLSPSRPPASPANARRRCAPERGVRTCPRATGSVVGELRVREGDRVKTGDIVVRDADRARRRQPYHRGQDQPHEIDQVHMGQPAVPRFTAFNRRTSPELTEEVVRIGADVTQEEKKNESSYAVRIRVADGELARLERLEARGRHAGRGLHPDLAAHGDVLSREADARPDCEGAQGTMTPAVALFTAYQPGKPANPVSN
jgi:hypothetical protein